MQIRLNIKIFIFVLFFFVTKQLEVYTGLMLFALLHEIGHIIIRSIFGLKARKTRNNANWLCSFF